jgi:hypothetical protein
MDSETDECVGAVGVSRTSSFLFSSCELNLIEQNGRRESARRRSETSLGGR